MKSQSKRERDYLRSVRRRRRRRRAGRALQPPARTLWAGGGGGANGAAPREPVTPRLPNPMLWIIIINSADLAGFYL